ncbi:MAG: hypothetical protein PHH86_00105 [Sphaerochaetaceae bacterium]|nr:hypothetical protein [Sphaerochaetaceae bacterium]NLV85119.1 hypothetical protein [Spirochaetales bacterium]
MGKKSLLLILVLVSALAYADVQDELTYQWGYLKHISGFEMFVASVLNDHMLIESEQYYHNVYTAIDTSSFPNGLGALAKAKASIMFARSYVELDNSSTQKIKELLDAAETLLSQSEAEGASRAMVMTLRADLASVRYLYSGKLGDALAVSKAIDAVYREFPNDLNARLLKADKMLYAPAIGGGDTRKALDLFIGVWNQIEKHEVCRWDLFTTAAGLGSALHKSKDDRDLTYISFACSLYSGDQVINELFQSLTRGQ